MASLRIGGRHANSVFIAFKTTALLRRSIQNQSSRFLQTSTTGHQKVPEFAFAFEYVLFYDKPTIEHSSNAFPG